MRQKITLLVSLTSALALLLSACGAPAQATPDLAGMSTAVEQTVEARLTK